MTYRGRCAADLKASLILSSNFTEFSSTFREISSLLVCGFSILIDSSLICVTESFTSFFSGDSMFTLDFVGDFYVKIVLTVLIAV